MVFKLATQAERHWRRLNSYQRITHLVDGDTFTDGELQLKKAAWKSATVARIRSLPRPRHAMDNSSTTFDNISLANGLMWHRRLDDLGVPLPSIHDSGER